MALGFDTGSCRDALPILKFDASAGRFLRIDRDETRRQFIDITENFRAVIDMERLEIGWMLFGQGAAPDMRLFPVGAPWTQAPTVLHRRGLRAVLQLDPAAGGSVREMCSTASGFLRGFDSLHDEWLAARSENPGRLPVVGVARFMPLRGGPAGVSKISYQPDFVITGWAERPAALPLQN
jgi:hypothetical protein